MRRDGLARQVVLGVDDARRAAGGSREGLQLVAPLRRFRLVDRAEVLGVGAVHLHALVAALFHQALGFAQLRVLRNALVHVTLHARQHRFRERIGVVSRARYALDRMAADTVEQLPLLLVGAGHARHPLAVRELRGEIVGLAQAEIAYQRLVAELHALVVVEHVARGAH